jgi:hypothetical protein
MRKIWFAILSGGTFGLTPMIILTILSLVVIAVAFAMPTKKMPMKIYKTEDIPSASEHTIPDLPVSFGYKCMWYAVKTDDKHKLADKLGFKNTTECNWHTGIDKAYKGSVFITPVIDGWTLACGLGLSHSESHDEIKQIKETLETLSREFGEAQYFCTHRVTEYHCWMKAVQGKLTRVFAYLGESGENLAIEGEPTKFEKTLNLPDTFSDEASADDYFDREDITWPYEQLVMEVAEHWSVDPSALEERKDLSPALGLIWDF